MYIKQKTGEIKRSLLPPSAKTDIGATEGVVLIDFGMSLAEEIKTFSITYLLSLHVCMQLFITCFVLYYVLSTKENHLYIVCSNNMEEVFSKQGNPCFFMMYSKNMWLVCVKHSLILTLFGNYVNKITAKPRFTVISFFYLFFLNENLFNIFPAA